MLMKRKLISALLALFVVVSSPFALPLPVFAADENTYENTGNQREDIIGVALTQLGNSTGNKYTFGNGNVSWCAYFVVWCARQAGIDSSIIALNGYATADDLGVEYRGRPADRSEEINYIPQRGDLIFFDWEDNGFCYKSPASFYGDHVGIVEYVAGGFVHTVEGNCGYMDGSTGPESGLCVRRRVFSLDSVDIKGYGIPNYQGDASPVGETTVELSVAKPVVASREIQTLTFAGTNCGIYTLRIYKDGSVFKTETVFQDSYEVVFSDPGVYSAYCTAYQDATCQVSVNSEMVTWTVVSSSIAGDVNGDGITNNKDLTRLMKYLAGEDVSVVGSVLDVNSDGVVNNKDLTRLMKYLAGAEVYIS